MMQTLKLLGVPVVGYLFHDDFSHKELNPKGYYDLPINETINGLNTDAYKGKAVKLGGAQLSKTDPRYISAILYCTREKEATLKSIKKLIDADHDIIKKYCGDVFVTPEFSYEYNTNAIEKYLDETTIPYMEVKYEYVIDGPKEMFLAICKFLGITTGVEKAINNVNKEGVCQ